MFYSQELNVYIHLVCRTLLNSLMQLCSRWHMTSSNNSEKRYEIDNFRCSLPATFQILPCMKPVSSRNHLLLLLTLLRFPSDSQHSLQKRQANSKSKSDVAICMWLEPVGQVLGPCMRFGSLAGSDASASMVKRRQSWLSSTKVKNSHVASACMQSACGLAVKQVAWQ